MIKLPHFNFEKIFTFVNKLSKREKLLFAGTLLVIVVVASDRLILRPIINTFNSLHQQVDDLEKEARTSLQILAQKDRILSSLKKYSELEAERKSPEEETVAFLHNVETWANESTVNLLYAKPAGEKGQGREKKYYIVLECEAQMKQLVQFFYALESSDQYLRIEKYSIQTASKESSVVRAAVTVSKTAF